MGTFSFSLPCFRFAFEMLLNAFRRLLSSSGSDTASRHSLLSDTPVWVVNLETC